LGIIECINGKVVFKVEGVYSIDVTFRCLCFDFGHEFSDPVCDDCDGGGEWCISIVLAEEFIGLVGGVVAPSCGGCDGIVKKERSFWCKLDIEGFGRS